MQIPNRKHIVKIILIGESSVGKTSIRKQYLGKGFNSTYMRTIGADFSFVNREEMSFQIWDIAGERNYNQIRKQFYSGASGVIFVFDIARPVTFDLFENWKEELSNQISEKIPLVFVGNKEDLRMDQLPIISKNEVETGVKEWEKELGMDIPIMYSSAKTGFNIDTLFENLVRRIKSNQEDRESSEMDNH